MWLPIVVTWSPGRPVGTISHRNYCRTIPKEVIVMQPIEEIRYLILAVQHEGNRMFAESLRPLDLTPSQAEVLSILQDHQPLSLTAKGQEMATRVHHVEEAMYQ